MVPPAPRTASEAAALSSAHCESSLRRRAGPRKVKYGTGPSGDTWVKRQVKGPAAPKRRTASVSGDAVERRLGGVEQRAVRRVQACLRDSRRRARAGEQMGEGDAGARAVARLAVDADPRLGHHAEDPFGAEREPVRAGPCA